MHATLKSLLSPAQLREADHRERLIEAMAESLLTQGYHDITIADVVRRARVSKRTFYEHFADKEDCYLATYSSVSGGILQAIVKATLRESDPTDRLRRAIETYVDVLQTYLPVSRSFLTELPGVSPRARTARREVHGRFAQLVRTMINQGREELPEVRELTPELATAIVGAIHELVLETFEGGGEDLSHVPAVAFELVRSILLAPPDDEAGLSPLGAPSGAEGS